MRINGRIARAAAAGLLLGLNGPAWPASGDDIEPYRTIPLDEDRLPPVDADTPAELETLTVVGTRTPRPVDRVPASVSVVSARDMEGRQASNLGEALADLPGVSIEGGPRANAQFLNVRGLSGPRVLLVVDGARQNFLGGHRSSLMADPALLKQVELLRGPASALWGSDALGGVVVLTTRDAADFLSGDARVAARLRTGYESVNGERLHSGIVAGRIGPFDGVVSLLDRDGGDYERGDDRDEPHTATDVGSRLARLSWLPEDSAHSLRLIHQGFEQDSVTPSNPSQRVNGDRNPLIDRRNNARYSVARYGFEGDAGNLLRAAQLNLYRDTLDIREDRVDEPRRDRTHFDTDGLNAHATLVLPFGAQPWHLTLGGDAFIDRAGATRNGQARPQYPDSERRMAGAFVQAELPLGAFSLVPGLRYDRYHAESRQDDSDDVDADAVSPKLGLHWRVNEALGLRASLSSAFRAPGLIEIYAAGQHFLGNDFTPNPNLRPEKARNLELGFELSLPGLAPAHALHLAGSLYDNRVEDFIELFVTVEDEFPAPRCIAPQPPRGCVNTREDGSIDPTIPPVYVGGSTSSRNLPLARIRGGELETRYTLGPVELAAAYTRIRGRGEDSGEPLLSIPADTVRSSLSWSPSPRLRTELGASHHFRQDRVPVTEDEDGNPQPLIPHTPAHTTWDLSLSWEPFGRNGRGFGLKAPRLVAGIDNLTDATYRHHLNVLESPGRNVRVGLSAGF